MTENRANDNFQCEGAYALAILYTFGYLGMLAALMLLEIPTNNRELLMTLVGIMSAAQLGIIKFYYDGTQAQVKSQAANIVRASRNEGALQEIAKAAPAVSAAAVSAATGKPIVVPPIPPQAPIQADNVQIDANSATVTEKP